MILMLESNDVFELKDPSKTPNKISNGISMDEELEETKDS